jgi:hypothetical protein
MSSIVAIAKELKEEGLQVLLLNHNPKSGFIHPLYQNKFDKGFSNQEMDALIEAGYDKGMAVMHGKCNPHLMALDFDEKNAPGRNLYQTWSNIVDPDILRKVVIERTRSNGFHVYFQCQSEAPLKALASSPTGDEWIACRSAKSNCITYCAPSPGYSYLQGSLFDLQEITRDEMLQLCDAAQQLNEFHGVKSGRGEVLPTVQAPANIAHILRKFDTEVDEDYTLKIIREHGWTIDNNIRNKIIDGKTWQYVRVWRPGRDTRDPASGNYWLTNKRLSIFTTSTIFPSFDSGKSFSHSPSRVLYYLNGEKWDEVYKLVHQTAEVAKIELPTITPMAYSVSTRAGDIWKVEVKGIIEWAESMGFMWMSYSQHEETSVQLVRVIDNIIHICDEKDLLRAYRQEIERNYSGEQSSRVLLAFMPSVMKYMSALPQFDRPLMRDEQDSAYIYFTNGVLRIREGERKLTPYRDLSACVFSRHIKEIHYKEVTGVGEFGQFIDNVTLDEGHKRFVMSCIGYILHHYKLRNYAKALMIIEDVEDQDEARGRSGKGLIAQFIEWIRYAVQQDGRNYKSDSQFKMQQINPGVQVFYLNDPAPTVLMQQFYNYITDDWMVEAKGKKSYSIPFRHSPKILITTNFLPNLESDSDKDRFIVMPIKKHYGSQRSIRDDFPDTIFFADEWPEERKLMAMNFAIECLQLYLSHGVITYKSEAMDRNASQRLIKSLVPEAISETIEQALEACRSSSTFYEFENQLKPYDLRKDTQESMLKAFEWKSKNELIIYKSALYQYVTKAYNMKNMTDRIFGKKVNIYLDKSGYQSETTRNNTKGIRIAVRLDKNTSAVNSAVKIENEKFDCTGDHLTALEEAPF